ncbi:ankyrin repeat-containing domain protein [Talaromyces proteolyticus]|uniref:Ankyrin repeat-containing domain protein n=1 Tax=Talaromyces proteolyticus TaxID=1131652 RepID=A0AAD4PUF7_9EURO|nr:ankyrin repeat-containing domain protein [Talaromyces proteolyticus]KAH8692155.1 ankyrin repeat-containing domain protein [Talaromyces proteolyticus]
MLSYTWISTLPPRYHGSRIQLGALNFQVVANEVEDSRENYFNERRRGPTALIAAARAGYKDMVKLLLENDADVDCITVLPIGRLTALSSAAAHGHKEVVQLLLDHGTSSSNYENALSAAVKYDHKDVVLLLLTEYSRYGEGTNPMWRAAEDGNLSMIELLLSRGFDGRKALVEVIRFHHINVVKFLLEEGTDPDVPSVRECAVGMAISIRNVHMIELLLHHGAHIHPETLKFTRWHGPKEMAEWAERFPVLSYTRSSMFPIQTRPSGISTLLPNFQLSNAG